MTYAQAFGIEVEVIPGISSVTAIPATQGIPLTRRGMAESFWVVTATTRTGGLSSDLELAARSTASVVILMGMRKLSEITALFMAKGRGDVPAMVVQSGTWDHERVVVGTVSALP